MADPTSDTPNTPNTPEDIRPRATIKLKPMTPPMPSADASAPAPDPAAPAADAEPAVRIAPTPSGTVPGFKQTIRLRPPTATPVDTAAPGTEVKPAIKIVPKTEEKPAGIPTAKPEESAPVGSPTIQLKKPESSTPTIQLKKPESSTPTIQLTKPDQEQQGTPAKKVGEAPVPPERKLTLKLKNQPAKPKEYPKNIIPGLNIPDEPPHPQKTEEQKPGEQPEPQAEQPHPVAEPIKTSIPVPDAVPDDTKKKKGKLPKVEKQKAPVTSADEPNWFFLTLSCLTLICVCFIAYLLFAQYMNMYEGMQIPIPEFLMPPK